MKYENLESGYYYHIFNQGNNKGNIFFEDRNYSYFLTLLKKYISALTEVYAYCLLPNHFHLLLRINDNAEGKNCSQAFSNFFNAYAKAINKSYRRSGSLFRRKFSRIKIENEDYLRKLILYIHTNAQHHGIAERFEDYPHSSYHSYFSNGKTSISKSYILNLFDSIENFRVVHRIKALEIDEQLEDFLLE